MLTSCCRRCGLCCRLQPFITGQPSKKLAVEQVSRRSSSSHLLFVSVTRSLTSDSGRLHSKRARSLSHQSITGTDKFLLHSLSYLLHVTQRQPERHRCCLPESLVQAAKNSTISNDSYPVKHFAMSLIMWDVSV